MCYFNNVTFYAACVAINERRVAENRHFLLCAKIKSKEELRKDQRSSAFVLCCGGQGPKTRKEAESLLDKVPRWLIPKLVLNLPMKCAIVLMFIAYIAGGIYGCIHLKQGLLFSQLISEDSYFYKYLDWKEQHFTRQVPVSFVITSDYTYSDPKTEIMIDALLSRVKDNKHIRKDVEINWLNTYIRSPFFDNSSEVNFINGLKHLFKQAAFTPFENDVVINEAGTKITASRVHLVSRDLVDSQEEGELMLETRDLADSAEIQCFVYSPLFLVAEQYISTLSQSLKSVGIALIAVFTITCIFMPHPVLILLVTIAVTSIMVGVFGYMYFFDIALSGITVVHMIMSVGFSIDFTAHICHGYMISTGRTTDIRVREAIDRTGAPIFHGALSSLIGIAILAMAKSYVFRVFAAVMSFVLIFGIAHALLLLPILLPCIGTEQLNEQDDDDTNGRKGVEKKQKSKNGHAHQNGTDNPAAEFDNDSVDVKNGISGNCESIDENTTKF